MKQRSDCEPIVTNRTILDSDWDFMTKDRVKAECPQCNHQNTCITIIEKLNNAQEKVAMELLNTIY